MAIITLKWKSKAQNITDKNGNKGTLISFEEKHESGKRKGEVVKAWIAEAKYTEDSKVGWLLDDETGFVEAPSYALDEIIDLKAKSAGTHKAQMQY